MAFVSLRMVRKWRLTLMLVIACLLTFQVLGCTTTSDFRITTTAPTNIHYVAKTGSDSNDGSIGSPWLTINHAVNSISGGDTLYIRGGVYNEYVHIKNLDGTSGQCTIISGYPGETATIDGTGVNPYNNTVLVDDCTYLVIENLEIRNCASAGIEIAPRSTAHYITMQNLNIHDTQDSAIAAGNIIYSSTKVTHITIDNVYAHHILLAAIADEGLSLIGVQYFEIKNCTICDTNGHDNIDAKVGCTHGSIHNNICYNGDSTVGGGIYVDGGYTAPGGGGNTTDIDIYSNICHDIRSGIMLAVETGDAQLQNIHIYNNIIYNCRQAFEVDYYSGSVISFTFINNTLYHNGDTSYGNQEIVIAPPYTALSLASSGTISSSTMVRQTPAP